MVGLSRSVSESTVVDAPEKSVGAVEFDSVWGNDGGICRLWEDSREELLTSVVRDSVEEDARNGGEGGRHKTQSNGRTWVHRTLLGP